jgi:hypothetical protein
LCVVGIACMILFLPTRPYKFVRSG